jgi:hypothetical protein
MPPSQGFEKEAWLERVSRRCSRLAASSRENGHARMRDIEQNWTDTGRKYARGLGVR